VKPAVAKQSVISSQYEKLRTAALSGTLAPEDRCGLALFLRRGMWGWARALTSVTTVPKTAVPVEMHYTRLHQQQSVIQLFAAMALNTINNQ